MNHVIRLEFKKTPEIKNILFENKLRIKIIIKINKFVEL